MSSLAYQHQRYFRRSTLFALLLSIAFSISPALAFDTTSLNDNKLDVYTSKHLPGEVNEKLMDRYYSLQNWESLSGQTGRQGIDGLYVRRHDNGRINRILFSEAKFGTSQLAITKQCGQQMTKTWLICAVDRLQASTEQSLLNPKLSIAERSILERNLDDYRAIHRLIEADNYHARLFQANVTEGRLRLTISDLSEVQGHIQATAPDYRAKIEASVDPQRGQFSVDLRQRPSKAGMAQQLFDNYFAAIEAELRQTGLPQDEVARIVRSLQQSYAQGHTLSAANQRRFLNERLNTAYEIHIQRAKTPKAKWAWRARQATYRAAQTAPSNLVRSGARAGALAMGITAIDRGWQAWQGDAAWETAIGETVAKGIVADGSMVLAEGIVQVADDVLRVNLPAFGAGLRVGGTVIVFDLIHHSWATAGGDLSRTEFYRETARSLFKAGISGTAASAAVLLGATPGGWVVIGVGMGGYVLAEQGIVVYEDWTERPAVSIDDILGHLPPSIRQRVTVLHAQDLPRQSLLDAAHWQRWSILDGGPAGRETILDTDSLPGKTLLEW